MAQVRPLSGFEREEDTSFRLPSFRIRSSDMHR